MKLRIIMAATASLITLPALAAAAAPVNAAVHDSIRQAFCPQPKVEGAAPAAAAAPPSAVEPARVFDNLYFVGDRSTSAWALTTSEGIILIDAGFHHNVEGTIIGGMRKLGLKPEDVKYVIVSHGHNDHFGGANLLQKTYKSRIVMSEADWEHMVTWPQRGSPAPFPDRDVVVKDGDVIRLGDQSVRMVVTPGHTPGTLSPIFEVRDGSRRHFVGYWGGDGAGHLDPAGLRTYAAAVDRFINLDPRVDVPLSNHVVADGALLKLPLLAARKAGEPHPFVTGNAEFRAWAGVLKSCAEAFLPAK
ncbi:MAG: MBL fold metallo-hydrolase [Proteobacteria bacterium]|jgi:metallo-beta-lactamase class B|nr:MBL fold metallo-hydrolase [Pseudomonadota bacterium]